MLDLARARVLAASVLDPELPLLTLEDLGILRDVREEEGRLVIEITPTYSGCPALGTIRADLTSTLHSEGFSPEVRTSLSPPWSSADITPAGRKKLLAAGIAPPHERTASQGPIPLLLAPPRPACPQCGSHDVEEISRFSSTACKALWRCLACQEPFDSVKAI